MIDKEVILKNHTILIADKSFTSKQGENKRIIFIKDFPYFIRNIERNETGVLIWLLDANNEYKMLKEDFIRNNFSIHNRKALE